MYYKAYKKASQDDFVLQSLQKILPSTTLYYKVCTKHFPVVTTLYYISDMTACLVTFEKERFCSFPHRQGNATGKRLETRHVGAAQPAFRARLPPILTLWTLYQTGWRRDADPTRHSRRTRVQPLDLQTINRNPSLRRYAFGRKLSRLRLDPKFLIQVLTSSNSVNCQKM